MDTNGTTTSATLATLENAPALSPTEKNDAPLLLLRSMLDTLEADADIRNDARKTGKRLGPVTGLKVLDKQLDGALCQGLHIMHGAPGTGKTALALQIAASCECPALYVSCEMAPMELLRRLTTRVTGTFLDRLKSGEYTGPEIRRQADIAVQSAPYLALLDATRAPASAPRILEAAAVLRSHIPDNPHLLIVIDSVHSWARSVNKPGSSEYESLTDSLKDLQCIAALLSCPILCITERNRANIDNGGQSAAKGTSQFEYCAESVIGLNTEATEEQRKKPFPVTLKLEKNRNGIQGKKITLIFDGRLQKFTVEEY